MRMPVLSYFLVVGGVLFTILTFVSSEIDPKYFCHTCFSDGRHSGALQGAIRRVVIKRPTLTTIMVGNEEMDAVNEHVRKSAAVSVVSLRAESLSADGDNIVISLRTKYSTAERKYSIPRKCLQDLIVDLKRLNASKP